MKDTLSKRFGVGAALLGAAVVLANACNYGLTLVLGRLLPRGDFGEAATVATFMLMCSLGALFYQLLAAKSCAQLGNARRETSGQAEEHAGEVRWLLSRHAFIAGALLTAVSLLAMLPLGSLLQFKSPWPLAILAVSIPIHLQLGVERGMLQGRLRFGRLASTLIVEAAARAGVTLLMLWLGYGVSAVAWGLFASVAVPWGVTLRWCSPESVPRRVATSVHKPSGLTRAVVVLLIAQVIISHGDLLVVKSTFSPAEAGSYAAVGLLGRSVFFGSWSIIAAVFPLTADAGRSAEEVRRLFRLSARALIAITVSMTSTMWILAPWLLNMLLGDEDHGVSALLGPYAVATSFFTIASLIAVVDLSVDKYTATKLLLAGAAAQSVAVFLARGSLEGVVSAQVIIMFFTMLALCGAHTLAFGRVNRTQAALAPTVST